MPYFPNPEAKAFTPTTPALPAAFVDAKPQIYSPTAAANRAINGNVGTTTRAIKGKGAKGQPIPQTPKPIMSSEDWTFIKWELRDIFYPERYPYEGATIWDADAKTRSTKEWPVEGRMAQLMEGSEPDVEEGIGFCGVVGDGRLGSSLGSVWE